MKLVEGKVVLITGASRGIGKAIALEYAKQGATVAFTYLNSTQKALEVEAELKAFGVEAKAYQSDASKFEQAKDLIEQVVADFGRIDVLINNAGITRDCLLMRMTEEQWDVVIDNNLKSAFNTIRCITPIMLRQRSGSIINMSSIVGTKGNPGQANYAASKAGLIGLTKSVAKEFAARGVRCNALAPGFIATEMTNELSDEAKKYWMNLIPMRRAGEAEEVAHVAVFLGSSMASYVTGQVINCCGGVSL
ncbi:MAG: 3-oxoacyl-[acyl-carrier-protein] reductase [Paludibacteraceae bacterium]|jgi:3-oxoacyl-[acyl-carrier protein] reductase|nr:3-oxoacyl-[acyl-carrier-protein] reductase [Paludibacteraceae bacterium]